MIKAILLSLAAFTVYGYVSLGATVETFKVTNAYHHCLARADVITDMEAQTADDTCRLETGYTGD